MYYDLFTHTRSRRNLSTGLVDESGTTACDLDSDSLTGKRFPYLEGGRNYRWFDLTLQE